MSDSSSKLARLRGLGKHTGKQLQLACAGGNVAKPSHVFDSESSSSAGKHHGAHLQGGGSPGHQV